jgi:RNA polymerase sigma factor for flagellar operon FliA
MNNPFQDYQATKDPAIKQKIILQYQDLVHKIIRNRNIIPIGVLSKEDYFAFGIEGLNNAIENYDPDMGCKFMNYAYKKIEGAILDASKKYLKRPPHRNNDINVETNKRKPHNIIIEGVNDQEYDTEQELNKNELKACLLTAIECLPERSRTLLRLKFIDNLSQKEIAKIFKVSDMRITQILEQSYTKLRKDKRLRELFNVGETKNNRGREIRGENI